MKKNLTKNQEQFGNMKKNLGEREGKLNIRRETQQRVKKSLRILRKTMLDGRIGCEHMGMSQNTVSNPGSLTRGYDSRV